MTWLFALSCGASLGLQPTAATGGLDRSDCCHVLSSQSALPCIAESRFVATLLPLTTKSVSAFSTLLERTNS